jgi:hypothetical protein
MTAFLLICAFATAQATATVVEPVAVGESMTLISDSQSVIETKATANVYGSWSTVMDDGQEVHVFSTE